MGREQQIINERKRKIKELRSQGINPYPHKFDKKQNVGECLKTKLGGKVKTAGRLMTKRDLGKIAFANLQDQTGKIQIVLQEKETPDKVREFFKKYIDSGDFVGVDGKIIKTKTGQISILVAKLELLSKAILPLPEKFHGLQDKEERYRKRYLDLVMNPEVKGVFEKRAEVIDEIREFMKENNVEEVQTPLLQPLYGGAEAEPFKTKLNALDMTLYLSISPELYLKRLITGGFERVYTICKNFRNEGIDRSHNPEFTMMEVYLSYKDYNDIMKFTEELLERLAKKIVGKTKVEYQGKAIDFKKPFVKMTMKDAVKKFAKVNPEKISPTKLNEVFEEKVEPKLIQPTFIIDYPKEICPLTKEHRKNPELVERFELFVNGMELANAYSELNDPLEQERRLGEQRKTKLRAKANVDVARIDKDFLNSMGIGMPPLGGVGIGIDRLVMLLTDSASIRDVILFPFMKPEE